MNIFKNIYDVARRVEAQVNPFDGGKTYANPQGVKPQPVYVQPRSKPVPGQAQVPYTQATADQYNAHPEQFVGRNAVDPKFFGYPPDEVTPTFNTYKVHGPVTPGYEQLAQQYENAMKVGDYTNPVVMGPQAVDPKYFGYPADDIENLMPGGYYFPNPKKKMSLMQQVFNSIYR